MKPILVSPLTIAFTTICLVAASSTVRGQGSLTPSGAPSPGMKTLEQMEPRTPISSIPYTITQSGSYYLTGNVHAAQYIAGITIRTNRVTLDLMGFTISSDPDSTTAGVRVMGETNAPLSRIVVKNGMIHGFRYGIRCEYGSDCRFSELHLTGAVYNGMLLSNANGTGNGNTLERCVISECGSAGIWMNGHSGQCNQNVIRSNVAL